MFSQMEIISREMIKPSSPTPLHLRELKLSFFDRLAIQVYTPFIFFYSSDQLVEDPLPRLKQSLADVLTVFYPLAGRIQDKNESIECNDKGAEFIEARVHAQLLNVIQDPNMEELRQYLPVQLHHHPIHGEKIVLAVQANLFDCGGIAVAVCLSHKIADGTSMATFMKAWATTSREEASEIVKPNFHVLAGHFPPSGNLHCSLDLSTSNRISTDKIVTKRFIFNNEKLESLKSAIATAPGSQVKAPSRVEAISAFIWKHFIEHNKHKNHSSFAALHLVNLRHRMNPPLREDQTFGNCVVISPAFSDPDQDGQELHHLAQQLRKGIRKVDKDYIEKFQKDGEGCYLRQCVEMEAILKQGSRLCNFTSWWKFPVYEVDYGWGEPVWVCTTPVPFKDVVILMGRPKGDGIEAWINMLKEDDINLCD